MRARRTMTARIAALAMLGSAVVTGLTWAAGPVPPAAATTTQAAPIELLQDGGFEDWSGPTAQPNQSWRVTANGNGTDNGDAGPICHQSRNCVDVTSHPRLGNGWLWFHSNPSTLPANTSVSQDVVIPVGVPVTLSFFFANFAARAPYSGRLTVQVDGVDVMWLSEQETTFDYRPRTVDLSAYATGTSHTLTFKYHRDFGSGPASILVDDVSLSTPGLSVDESIPDLVPVHFSDQLPLTFSATSHQAPGHRLTATVQGLPKGLSLATSAVSQGSSTWEFIGRVVAAASPVPYPVLVTVSDEVQEQQLRFSIRVDPESASVAYTGPTRAMPDATGDKPVDLLLTAHVTQQADGDPGQLSLANRATFVDLDHNNEVLCTSEVDDSGQASCRHLGALPAGADGRTYRIQVLVGDDTYFTRARSAPVPVTVGVTGPDRWLLSSSASFTFASTRAGTSFACSLDGAAPTSCGSPYAVSGLGPATHVVTVAAAQSGLAAGAPVRSVFTVPYGARALRADGWTSTASDDAYLGRYWTTKHRGAELTLKKRVSGARQLALVVATAPRAGQVKVYLGDKLVGKVSLRCPRSASKLVELKPFATPRSGKLRIVTTNGKRVQIAGVGVATG